MENDRRLRPPSPRSAAAGAAWQHYEFINIHPFQDGNGRVGRALLAYEQLAKSDLLPIVVERDDRSAYIDALESADGGDLAPLTSLSSSGWKSGECRAAIDAASVRSGAAREHRGRRRMSDSKPNAKPQPAYALPDALAPGADIRLYQGDCADILPALTADDPAHLIITSPPYDNLRDFGGHDFDFGRVAPAVAQGLTRGGGIVLGRGGWAELTAAKRGLQCDKRLPFMDDDARLVAATTRCYARRGNNGFTKEAITGADLAIYVCAFQVASLRTYQCHSRLSPLAQF